MRFCCSWRVVLATRAQTQKHCNFHYILKVLLTSSSKQGCAIPAETEGHAPGNKAVVEVEKQLFLSQFGHFLAPRDRVAKNGSKSDDVGGILEPTWRAKLIQNA